MLHGFVNKQTRALVASPPIRRTENLEQVKTCSQFSRPNNSEYIKKGILLHKTPLAMRFSAKITSSCIWVAITVDLAILHWYACGADRRSVGQTVQHLSKAALSVWPAREKNRIFFHSRDRHVCISYYRHG